MKVIITLTLILTSFQLVSFGQNHLEQIIINLESKRLDSLVNYFDNAKSSSNSSKKGDISLGHMEFKRLEKGYIRLKLRFSIIDSIDYSDGTASMTSDYYIIDIVKLDTYNIVYSRMYKIPEYHFYHRNNEKDILHLKLDTLSFHRLYQIHDSIYETTTAIQYEMPNFMEPSLFSYFDKPYEKRYDEQERVNRLILNKDQDSLKTLLLSFNYEAKSYALCGFYTLKKLGVPIDIETERLINKTLTSKGDVQYCYDRKCRGTTPLYLLINDSFQEEWFKNFEEQHAKELNTGYKK